MSSLGKGLASASIGALLESRGLKVTMIKIDPYINVDPGTMSPFQHGEVFVTDDGAETDLDLGHYERYVSTPMSEAEQLHHRPDLPLGHREGAPRRVPRRDRAGDPAHHRRDQGRASSPAAEGYDVAIVEIGGTVGDIESLPFLEAIRQFRCDRGRENVLYVHLTLVPYIATAGEVKTKPTQHSVKELTGLGIQPDILLCRTERPLDPKIKEKIALFCNVEENAVITRATSSRIYELPLAFHDEGLDERIVEKLNIWTGAPSLRALAEARVDASRARRERVTIAIVGKYVDLIGLLQEPERGAGRTAASPTSARVELDARRLRARSRRTGSSRRSAPPTRSWCRWASGRAAPRARSRRSLRARERRAVLRHLLRHADGGDRVRAPRVRARGRQLDRGRIPTRRTP